ncbi:MAG TPA: rhombotarget lipoprotein [Telluria sp.]
MRTLTWPLLLSLFLALSGCWSMPHHSGAKQAGSIVDYLYPDAKEAPAMQATVTRLQPPVRVGIAFAPSANYASLPEATKQKLLERVKSSFSQYEFIGDIQIIPSQYLRPRGGFDNLDQVARLFNVEVVALVSYDQVQFKDASALSVLYWTVVGAYVIRGDKYDVQTLVDAAVFDVKSRKLLFRAPGTSQIKGSATMVGFSEHSRAAQAAGYDQAIAQMIPQLQAELSSFRERIKSDAGFKVVNKEGYKGGGSLGWPGAMLGLILAMGVYAGRRGKR